MWGMNRMGSSLVAGAAAAAGLFLIQLGFGASIEGWSLTALYWIVLSIGFSAVGANNRQDLFRRLCVALLGAVGVAFAWFGLFQGWERYSSLGMSLLAFGLMLVFAGVRSGVFDEGATLNPRRALLVEVGLGGAALLFASWLAGPSPFGPALSLWGYALVQSLYACVPRSFLGSSVRPAKGVDPFESALARLESILNEPA